MQIYEDVNSSLKIDQGDVFTSIPFPAIEANVNAVLITPTCDIEQDKAFFLKFVATVPPYVVVSTIAAGVGIEESALKSGKPLNRKQADRLMRGIRNNATGNLLPRFYLLTEYLNTIPASYLDFQRVFVVLYEQVINEYLDERIARILSPWREDIVARYSGYSMRVGVPDYSVDDLKKIITSVGITLP